jgi:hypothetical protein
VSTDTTPPRVFVILEEIKKQVSDVREQLIELRADQKHYDLESKRNDARLTVIEADVRALKDARLQAQGAVTGGQLVWRVIWGAVTAAAAYFGWKFGKG